VITSTGSSFDVLSSVGIFRDYCSSRLVPQAVLRAHPPTHVMFACKRSLIGKTRKPIGVQLPHIALTEVAHCARAAVAP
jgi:hypothetical protein